MPRPDPSTPSLRPGMAVPADSCPILKSIDCRLVGDDRRLLVRLAFFSAGGMFSYIDSFLRASDHCLVRAFATEADARDLRAGGSSFQSLCEEIARDRRQARAVLVEEGYCFSDEGESVVVWLRADDPRPKANACSAALGTHSTLSGVDRDAFKIRGNGLSIEGESQPTDVSNVCPTESTRDRIRFADIPTVTRCINMVCPRNLENGVFLPGKDQAQHGIGDVRPSWVLDHLQMALRNELGDNYNSKHLDKAKG